MIVVDAMDERAAGFYEAHGFIAGRFDAAYSPDADHGKLDQARAG